jgi:5-methyltetrahydrofolate--homocysteine methyltransferase
MSVTETERWLAPILNYIPAQDQSAELRAVRAAMPAAVAVAEPANDAASRELASHPQGCTCAVHLAWRKKAVGAG